MGMKCESEIVTNVVWGLGFKAVENQILLSILLCQLAPVISLLTIHPKDH